MNIPYLHNLYDLEKLYSKKLDTELKAYNAALNLKMAIVNKTVTTEDKSKATRTKRAARKADKAWRELDKEHTAYTKLLNVNYGDLS